ncbi:hypothetical protein [Natronorubrum tibetense]|uniref:CARDB domain-containing protein n=1 Tax=Natronorubrum tibetense GA33 TaxID=1114856 RepID=L9VJ90_9EURY|nr:hypothetical protein [Natronorubrum tibetense]ELY37275.1 hypothetical protein C496_20610 [Natronorubrum tibetense GA33]
MHRRTALAAITGASLSLVTGGATDWTTTPPVAVDGSLTDDTIGPADATERAAADLESDVSFEGDVVEIVECGRTCREVTTTLTNTGTADATAVRVAATVVAGETLVWETDEEIGRLEAGATVTRTQRIDIDVVSALAIENNDRTVTITTTITSAQQTEQFVTETTV